MANTSTHNESVFRAAYERLNESQKRAVDTIEGPVMVMAGPGTGKTQVLTLRIANILKQTDTPPDAILALTYTNSGVAAMRERLKTFIGHDAYRVHIYTFHGYASSVIEGHPTAFPRIIGATSADDIDRYDIVRTAIADTGSDILRPSGDPEYYIKPVLSLIGALKSDNVSIDEYEAYVNTLEGEEGAYGEEGEPSTKVLRSVAFLSVFREYERLMRVRNLYDYSDMLVELVRALRENESLRLELAESAQYILADEHQDANRAQNAMLELLASAHPDGGEVPNLFIVGDDKQAIYRFQGASLENFLFFQHRFPRSITIPLSANYRSTETILAAAGKLMEGKSLPGELVSVQGVGTPFTVIEAETLEEEVEEIVERIGSLIASGVPTQEIALLLRKNRDIDAFARSLRAHNIPFVSHRDSDALSTGEMVLLLALIRAVVDPHDDRALATALFAPRFALGTNTIARLLGKRRRSEQPLFELLSDEPEGAATRTCIESLHKAAHVGSAIETLDTLVSETGFLSDIMGAHELPAAISAYRSVRELIETRSGRDERYTLKDAVSLIDDLERGVVNVKVARSGGGAGVVLMSLHKSKGLEFEHVFLPHALESRFKPRADRSLFYVPPVVNQPEPDWDDERRLFYVGITRAKKCVYASHHLKRNEDKEEKPLPFLSEVGVAALARATPRTPELPRSKTPTSAERSREYQDIIGTFLESGISATALNAYLADPWACFFKNILRLPETQAAHQMYGTAIHAALERMYEGLKNGEPQSADALTGYFSASLARAPLRTHERKIFSEKGREALRGYYEEYQGTFNATAETEVSFAVDLALPEGQERKTVHIRGFIDRLEVVGDTAHVFDYKTGKVKSRNEILGATQSSDGSIHRQLVFYKLLLDLDGRYRMGEATIDFIEPNPRGKYKRESFLIDEEAKQALIIDIARMTDDLIRGDFLALPAASDDAEIRGLAEMIKKRFLKKE